MWATFFEMYVSNVESDSLAQAAAQADILVQTEVVHHLLEVVFFSNKICSTAWSSGHPMLYLLFSCFIFYFYRIIHSESHGSTFISLISHLRMIISIRVRLRTNERWNFKCAAVISSDAKNFTTLNSRYFNVKKDMVSSLTEENKEENCE